MKKKRILSLTVILIISAAIWLMTNNNDTQQMIATDKVLPANIDELMYEQGEQNFSPYLLKRAKNEDRYMELWDLFQLKEEHDTAPYVNFNENDVLFIGAYESGVCPLQVRSVSIDEADKSMTIELTVKTGLWGGCTDDATPRTFVIKVVKDIEVVTIREGSREVTIEFE